MDLPLKKILVDPEPKDRAMVLFSEHATSTTLRGLEVFLFQEQGAF